MRQHSENASQTWIWAQLAASNHENLEISNIHIMMVNLADTQLLPKSIELNAPWRKLRSYLYLSSPNCSRKTNNSISRTKPAKHQKSDRIMTVIGRQITTAPVLLSEHNHTVACSTSHEYPQCASAQRKCF